MRRGTGVILSTRIYLLEMPLPRCVRGSDAGANSVLKPRPQEEHAATGETSLSHGRFVPVSTPPGAVSQMRLSNVSQTRTDLCVVSACGHSNSLTLSQGWHSPPSETCLRHLRETNVHPCCVTMRLYCVTMRLVISSQSVSLVSPQRTERSARR